MTFRFLLASYVAAFLLVGCGPKGVTHPLDAAGEYIYTYSNNEVEVLSLQADMTYQHALFKDIGTLRANAAALFTNSGFWSFKTTSLEFKGWLMSVIPQP
jgi:hypothetical protein